jgi:hypothetical protein
MDASEKDAEQTAERARAEEDKIAETLAESKRVADELEEGETEDAIRLVESGDAETVALSQAQVAGMPTQDTEAFKENIGRTGMKEIETPSDGNCFYYAATMSVEGTPVDLALTPNGMRDHSVDMALKRGDIDEAEAELRRQRGRMVAYPEVQATATTLRCRVLIYHARPGEGEPDMDIVVPEGNGSVLRDICMVLRSAHYTALLSEQQWQKVEQCRSSDALRKSTRRNIRCHRQVATVPEIGVPRGGNVTQSWCASSGSNSSGSSVTQSSRELGWEAFRQRAMAPPPWTPIVSPLMADGKPDSLAREIKNPCNAKFAMRAVPTRAAKLGYAEDSDYDKLTRKQRKEATRFTHGFDVVGVTTGVTTQPKGTGKSQEAEQVGSSGETTPRETKDVYPFNQTALQARSTERSRKAKAENELAMQRQMRGRGYGSSTNSIVHFLSNCTTTDQCTPGLPETEGVLLQCQMEDMQQALRRRAAVWAMKNTGQDPEEDFNGSRAQRMVQEQIESSVAETDGTEDQGIEGHDLVWWFHNWQHWQQDKDRKLSSCTDFDAMHFARTRKVCLGGAWGCILAQMQETACDNEAVEMLRSTFRLASATCRRRTPGVILFSGVDAQQMSDEASHSSSSAGSGTGGGAGGETESAAGEQPASGEERASGQHRNEDNISAARRALNQTELMLAQSQAVLIMRGLMDRLTTVVTNSLRSDDGSEEATMIAEGAGEHHQMLIAVRAQAAGLARTAFRQVDGQSGEEQGARSTGSLRVSLGTSGTESASVIAAARALEELQAANRRQVNETANAVSEQRASGVIDAAKSQAVEEEQAELGSPAEQEMEVEGKSKAEQARFEAEVTQVIAQAGNIEEKRSVSKWEKVLREAVKEETAKDRTDVAQALLALGIPDRHWRPLEVRKKLEKGEWVIFNVNVKVEHQHFVLLKPRSKTVAERIGHVVLKGEANGLCAFTAALQIAKAAGALEPESSWDKAGDKRTYTEFAALKRAKSIGSSRNFAALMQVKALYEQITAHMHRGETAAQEAARASGRNKPFAQSVW